MRKVRLGAGGRSPGWYLPMHRGPSASALSQQRLLHTLQLSLSSAGQPCDTQVRPASQGPHALRLPQEVVT